MMPLVVLLVFAGMFLAMYLIAVYWPEEVTVAHTTVAPTSTVDYPKLRVVAASSPHPRPAVAIVTFAGSAATRMQPVGTVALAVSAAALTAACVVANVPEPVSSAGPGNATTTL